MFEYVAGIPKPLICLRSLAHVLKTVLADTPTHAAPMNVRLCWLSISLLEWSRESKNHEWYGTVGEKTSLLPKMVLNRTMGNSIVIGWHLGNCRQLCPQEECKALS